MIAFVYNNNKHESIQVVFSKILKIYLFNLKNAFENKMLEEKTSFAIKRAKILRNNRKHLIDLWKRSAKQQIKYYNQKHQSIKFKVKDKILLRELNIRTYRLKKKIDHKMLECFSILKRVNTQVYLLNLSTKYEIIHSIFYIFLLKSWHSRDANSKSQSIWIDEEEEWEMKKMLNHRVRRDKLEYLI